MTTGQNARQQDGPRPSAALPEGTLLSWLREMQLIREFETRTMQAYQSAKIGGFCHIYSGQEAVAVGTTASLDEADPIITAYRDHGHALAVGTDPKLVMAEMHGRISGVAKGKGGSMHMFDRSRRLYGGHGIVGAQTPLGAGLAFACRYEWEVLGTGPKRVALCFLGDGAVDQGAFHEALNLAALFGLPVIFVIENNGYSMGTAIHRHTANHDNLISRGASYGMTSVEIDGLDIVELYDAFRPIVDGCREHQRPAFIDMKTYRYYGHSMSDPQKYRTKEEVDAFRDRDSIDRLASRLMASGELSEEGWKGLQKEIRDLVREAVDFAENDAAPDPGAEMFSDVYALPQPGLSPHATYRHGARNPLL